jgi:hypothetical protein
MRFELQGSLCESCIHWFIVSHDDKVKRYSASAIKLELSASSLKLCSVCHVYTRSVSRVHGCKHIVLLNQQYDLILDILGKGSFTKSKKVLTPKGIYLLASFKTKQLWQMMLTSKSQQKVICALSSENQKDLELIKNFANKEKSKPLLTKTIR